MGGHKLRGLTTTGVRRAGRRCTLRDMRLLAPTSASGTAILAFVLLAVLWEGFAAEGAGHGPRLRPHAAPSPSALASFVGVGLFAFAGEIAISDRELAVRPPAARWRRAAVWRHARTRLWRRTIVGVSAVAVPPAAAGCGRAAALGAPPPPVGAIGTRHVAQ